ncbi:hypothetical protein AMK15_34225 [Streptomyces sp. MJM1172]|nr:hypothetical protein AMK15_34225 [Streptomyces sp. MJM1172]
MSLPSPRAFTERRTPFSITVPFVATPVANSSSTRRRWPRLWSPHSQSAQTVAGYSSGSVACSCAATSGRPAANASASFTTWWKTSVRRKFSSEDAFTRAVCSAASRAPRTSAERPSAPRSCAAWSAVPVTSTHTTW